MEADLPEGCLTPPRVLEVGVAAVDDDVALLEERCELVDHGVGAGPALTMMMILRGRIERGDELLEGLRPDERAVRP